jgi:hypothetical protein
LGDTPVQDEIEEPFQRFLVFPECGTLYPDGFMEGNGTVHVVETDTLRKLVHLGKFLLSEFVLRAGHVEVFLQLGLNRPHPQSMIHGGLYGAL